MVVVEVQMIKTLAAGLGEESGRGRAYPTLTEEERDGFEDSVERKEWLGERDHRKIALLRQGRITEKASLYTGTTNSASSPNSTYFGLSSNSDLGSEFASQPASLLACFFT